jgi:GMP synthase-like glutamine amidotransferase
MKILIVKNGCCDTDINRIIHNIDPSIEIDLVTSVDLIDRLNKQSKKYVTHNPTITNMNIHVQSYNGVIIMGGYQSLTTRRTHNYEFPHFNDLIDHIKNWIKKDIHILGICLGAQMIGEAVGLTTVKMDNPIKGYDHDISINDMSINDKLLKNNMDKMTKYVLSCHYDRVKINDTTQFDHGINKLEIIATYEKTDIPYIFKINNAYGVQFHPEVTERILKEISKIFDFNEYTISFEKSNINMINKASKTFFTNWLEIIPQDIITN